MSIRDIIGTIAIAVFFIVYYGTIIKLLIDSKGSPTLMTITTTTTISDSFNWEEEDG